MRLSRCNGRGECSCFTSEPMKIALAEGESTILPATRRKLCDESRHAMVWGGQQVPAFATDAAVLWTRLRPIRAADMAHFPSLRYIVCPATGTDHIDHAEAERRGIKVLSLKGEPGLVNVRATVEHTIGLILALTRRIPAAAEHVRRGGWDRYAFEGTDLAGKWVLVVGNGRIGRQVRKILHDLGCCAYYTERNPEQGRDLLSLLPAADLVTVHCDLNPTSRGLFGPAEFAAMKPGAFFINTARGAIVQEQALLDALRGHLGGAALDVVEGEPGCSDALRIAAGALPNLIVTPHIGGCTREAREQTEGLMVDRLLKEVADGHGLR